MQKTFSLKTLKVIVSVLIMLSLAVFVYLLFCTRPQSDDIGFLNLLDHYGGIWSTYVSLRQNLDAGAFTLLFTLPLISLSKYVSPIWLMIGSYGLFFLSVYNFTNYLAKIRQLELSRIASTVFSLLIILFIIFTSWNRNTYQNGTFWLTGVIVYILPIAIMIWAIISTLKKDYIAAFPLFFIIGNTRINYVLLFGIILAILFFLDFRKKWRFDKFWFVATSGLVSGLLYYLLSPGNYVRLNKTGVSENLNDFDFYVDLILSSFENMSVYLTEPYYLLFFTLICITLLVAFPEIHKLFLFNNRVTFYTISGILLALWIHGIFIGILLNGNLGYGRIYLFGHILYIAGYLLLITKVIKVIRPFIMTNWISKGASMALAGTIILLILYQQTRWDLYRATRFSAQYDQRYDFIQQMRYDKSIACLVFNRFNNAGIIGIEDIQPEFDCDFPRTNSWIYGQIIPYDNWVFEEYYDLPFKIITVDRFQELPYQRETLSYDIVRR